jgi:hypothetical protein
MALQQHRNHVTAVRARAGTGNRAVSRSRHRNLWVRSCRALLVLPEPVTGAVCWNGLVTSGDELTGLADRLRWDRRRNPYAGAAGRLADRCARLIDAGRRAL